MKKEQETKTTQNQPASQKAPETLTQNQAVNVLIQAANIAQGKGAFTLEDAELVSKAIRVFKPEGANAQPAPDGQDTQKPDDQPTESIGSSRKESVLDN